MSFLTRVIIHILANSAAIIVADRLIPSFIFRGNWPDLFLAGAILGIVNSFIRPVIKFLAFPLVLLTLGLFSIIINITMLFLATSLLPSLLIKGFWAGFWGVIVISLVNNVILSIANKDKD